MNFLSTKILLAIYNKLSDISVNIDDILMKKCMKLIQPLIEQDEFEKAKDGDKQVLWPPIRSIGSQEFMYFPIS